MSDKNSNSRLSDLVKVAPYYQRSVQLNEDIGRQDAIDGYICHETARIVLHSMAQQVLHTNQRAFTWTGPYGSGKSSLALVLSNALSHNQKAQVILRTDTIAEFSEAFPTSDKGWLIIPVVGSRRSFITAISEAVEQASNQKCDSKDSIFKLLKELSISGEHDGVLLVIDEMGKFLEAAQTTGDDVYFFQELAELCSRTPGNLITVGILHQSFKQYGKVQRLSESTQNEWAKVHGRYTDIPLISSTDEVIELLGNAIDSAITVSEPLKRQVVNPVAESIRSRRQGVSTDIEGKLVNCWPLHPTTMLIIGPASKKQYSQNERSVFSFLGSSESFGFQEFLKTRQASAFQSYTPADYWDYLQANMEPAILASTDSHRWSIASNAVSKAEAIGTELHIAVVKNIAAIDLFKNGSGLAADIKVLKSLFSEHEDERLKAVISELEAWKIIVHRKFNQAWSVFEGSDFDIEKAVAAEKASIVAVDTQQLSNLARFRPVIAKKHLYDTGTLRWMGVSIAPQSDISSLLRNFKYSPNEFGQFIVLIDSTDNASVKSLIKGLKSETVFAVGRPENADTISDLAKELLAYEAAANRPELEGDNVARKEVHSRIVTVKTLLERQLSLALKNIEWHVAGNKSAIRTDNLSRLASDLADEHFALAPKIFSELLNRDSLSSSSVSARRNLLYKMLSNIKDEDLGIDGYPAEKGLYLTTLKNTGLHRKIEAESDWGIAVPQNDAKRLAPLWHATDDYIKTNGDSAQAADIYEMWRKPPFGLKDGLMPILFWAYALSNTGRFAIYRDGTYLPTVGDIDIDYSLQNIKRIELRGVELTPTRLALLGSVANALDNCGITLEQADPLTAARKLVAIVYKLEPWARITRSISKEAIELRDLLLKASDPHKVIFYDLEQVFKAKSEAGLEHKLVAVIQELTSAYSAMLQTFDELLKQELDAKSDVQVRQRAKNLKGTAGDFFIEAFLARLATYDGAEPAIAGLMSLVSEKPLTDWTDKDVVQTRNQIIQLSGKFRELETIAGVNARHPARQAIALVYGAAGKDFVRHIQVDQDAYAKLEDITATLLKQLKSTDLDQELQFAVIAKTLEKLRMEDSNHGC
ncbi:ATP-binding protein [Alkalimonas mucilaginosa]|uniref:ATP-binding protein n=1 Tax=Alkalimonas mucilaginosa TaxID=3057676 RepID=A0ABU7JI39_9GAMM|nr:ATP-binding protein [Alkalimonas sp. MEB004]MEE2025361.1 ATP-binding protein [Alkalimonas sp. MEB004]